MNAVESSRGAHESLSETLAGPARGDNGRALGEVVQRLSFARSLVEIQQVVRTAARHLTRADGASFVLREGDCCFYADEDAVSPLWRGQRFPMSACISGWVMLNRRSAVVSDIYEDDRVLHDAYRPTFVKSLAMVPIRQLDPIGAIGNYWASRHEATAEEIALLQALADCTAVAIENVRVNEQLEHAHHEILRHVTAAAEDERSRWARELHDQTLQSLGGLKITLTRARRQADLDAWRRTSDDAVAHIDQEIANLRAMITDLRPPALDQLGLRAALAALGESHKATSGLSVRLHCPATLHPAGAEIETTVYRFVQEALTNIVKHARAGSAVVRVSNGAEAIRVEVSDDGVGFDPNGPTTGFGIVGARERLGLVGGVLSFDSDASGTTVTATIPVVASSQPADADSA